MMYWGLVQRTGLYLRAEILNRILANDGEETVKMILKGSICSVLPLRKLRKSYNARKRGLPSDRSLMAV